MADAVRRGRMLRCKVCGEKGATMGCVLKTCKKSFHLPCARASQCALQVSNPSYPLANISEASVCASGMLRFHFIPMASEPALAFSQTPLWSLLCSKPHHAWLRWWYRCARLSKWSSALRPVLNTNSQQISYLLPVNRSCLASL